VPHVIRAEHLKLVLVARRIARHSPTVTDRWAAMSSGQWSVRSCRPGRATGDCQQYPLQPLMQPMSRGGIARVIERTRAFHGLAEVNRTWRTGLRALKAEIAAGVLR
jgi:hypothetical protein